MHRHQLELGSVSSFASETRNLAPASSTGPSFVDAYVLPVCGRTSLALKHDGNGPFPQKHLLFVLSKPLLWSWLIFILTVLASFPSQERKITFEWLQTGRPS